MFGVLFLVGLAFALVVNRHGVDLSNDTASYITAARQLVAGQDIRPGLGGYFAPGYSVAVGAVSWVLHIGVYRSAEIVDATLFAVTLVVAGQLVREALPGPRWFFVAVPLLLIGAPDLLDLQVNVASDGMSLAVVLVAMLGVARHVRTGSPRSLALAVGAIAVACLTRYANFGFAIAGMSSIVLCARYSFVKRLRSAAWIAAAAIPTVIWDAITPSTRGVYYHRVTVADLKDVVRTIGTWIGVSDAHPQRSLAAGLLVVIVAVVAWALLRRGARDPLPDVLMVSVLCYIAFVIVSISFLDRETSLAEPRMLAPVHVLLIVSLVVLVGARIVPALAAGRRTEVRAIVALAAVLPVLAVARGSVWTANFSANELEWNGPHWRDSALINQIEALPDVPIVSNASELVYLRTGRAAVPVPEIYSPQTVQPNADVAAEVDHVVDLMRTRNARLVYANTGRTYVVSVDTLRTKLAQEGSTLSIVSRNEDGAIYVATSAS